MRILRNENNDLMMQLTIVFLFFSPVLTPVQSTHETNLVYESLSVGSLHFVIFEMGGSLSSMILRCGDDDDADLCYDCVLHPLS